MPQRADDTAKALYREWTPTPSVERAVIRLWTRDVPADATPAGHTVVPDNCADIILRIAPDGEIGTAYVVGPMSAPLVVPELLSGTVLGVRFRPGWAASTFRVAARDLRDLRVRLDDVWPALARDLARVDVQRAEDAVGAFGRVLGAYLGQREEPPATVRGALAHMETTRGRVPISALCAELRVTRQHLARLFEEHVGLRPKFVARVARLQHAMEHARRAAADTSWSALAFETGYADQAHLVGDFTELTGASPAAWLARR